MIQNQIKYRFPNSLIVIDGSPDAMLPNESEELVWAGKEAICVGTLSEADGDSEVFLSMDQEVSNLTLMFEGMIDTPHKALRVGTVTGEVLMLADVAGEHTKLQIYANHNSEPNLIGINMLSGRLSI